LRQGEPVILSIIFLWKTKKLTLSVRGEHQQKRLRPVCTFFFHKKELSFTFPTNQIARFTPDKSETGCAISAGGVAIVSIGRSA
jgi:hypothetical protein